MGIGYRAAIQRIAENDDTEFLEVAQIEDVIPSVALCMIADLQCVPIEKAIRDLRKAVDIAYPPNRNYRGAQHPF